MARNYYKQAAMILGGAVAAPVTLALIGFTPAGVAAGSFAAVIQSGIGNVGVGSLFATMQYAGTAPGLVSGATAAGGLAATFAARYLRRRRR